MRKVEMVWRGIVARQRVIERTTGVGEVTGSDVAKRQRARMVVTHMNVSMSWGAPGGRDVTAGVQVQVLEPVNGAVCKGGIESESMQGDEGGACAKIKQFRGLCAVYQLNFPVLERQKW